MKNLKDDKREQMKLEKRLRKMQKSPHVAVGILQDEPVDDDFTMVDLATVHEFGSKDRGIPARSFFRSTLDLKRSEYVKLIAKLQDAYVVGKLTMKQALTQLGEVVVGDMKETIVRGIAPPLSKETIKRKKSPKPLIHNGHLKGSITHQVREVT
jgi:hypothetical protein